MKAFGQVGILVAFTAGLMTASLLFGLPSLNASPAAAKWEHECLSHKKLIEAQFKANLPDSRYWKPEEIREQTKVSLTERGDQGWELVQIDWNGNEYEGMQGGGVLILKARKIAEEPSIGYACFKRRK